MDAKELLNLTFLTNVQLMSDRNFRINNISKTVYPIHLVQLIYHSYNNKLWLCAKMGTN